MKITFKSVLIGLAAIVGIVGFCMMFLEPLILAPGLENNTLLGILNDMGFNDGKFDWQVYYFGNENGEYQHLLGAVGFILMLVGALLTILVAVLSNKKGVNIIVLLLGIITAILFAVGGILALCTEKDLLKSIAENQIISALPQGIRDPLMQKFDELLGLGTGPTVGGILGLVAAALTIVGVVIPGPKKAKKGKRK